MYTSNHAQTAADIEARMASVELSIDFGVKPKRYVSSRPELSDSLGFGEGYARQVERAPNDAYPPTLAVERLY